MSQDDLLLVAGMGGLAVAITLMDLLFSLIRHRRAHPEVSARHEATVVTRSQRIGQRLTAIQNASADQRPPVSPASS